MRDSWSNKVALVVVVWILANWASSSPVYECMCESVNHICKFSICVNVKNRKKRKW